MSADILYTGVRIIDGSGSAALENAALLVRGNRIKGIGAIKERGEEDRTIVDLKGKTIVPGLINTHVHILLEPVGDPFTSLLKDSTVKTTIRGIANLKKHLLSGVTYLRDMGGYGFIDVELKKCLQQGMIRGPGLKVSGKMLTMTGGQGWSIGRECDGPDEVRKAAREQLKAGVDFVKLMATGGVMTQGSEPGTAQLTREEMQAAVEEAHKSGRKAAAHVQGRTGARNALLAGVDTIEHGVFLDDELLEIMLQQGAYLVPTLSAPHWIIQYGKDHGIPEYVVEKTKRMTESHLESVRKAVKAGVKIAMGTDSGTPFNSHDQSPFELKLMVDAGLSPMEAIITATKTAAEMLGIDKDYGTLEEGKIADFLVLSRNPLDKIEALLEVDSVHKDGAIVKEE